MKEKLTREGWQRLCQGHPWILKRHIKGDLNLPKVPALVPLGEHWFFYSPQSEICLRRLGPATRYWPQTITDRQIIVSNEQFKRLFFTPLLEIFIKAYQRKQQILGKEQCLRWIFSENDFIPGLVVDVFSNTITAQIQTAAMEFFWPIVKEIITSAWQEVGNGSPTVLELRNTATREKEGLEKKLSENFQQMQVLWNGLHWLMTPGGLQKTGAYLDQRDNHRRTVTWAKQLNCKEAWDLFSFEGGFGIHLAKAGLTIQAIDQSQVALTTAVKNANLNNISSENYQTEKMDVFLFLRAQFDAKNKTDLIVLDPPPFSRTAKEKASAMRGYKELNLRAMHCLQAGGLLVSCSCSHHISREDFYSVLQSAAHDARRSVRILEVCGPAPDHIPLLSFRESEYLQAWFLLVE